MLIVSKFHDYYDTALGLGIDKSIVYKRDKIEAELENGNPFIGLGREYPQHTNPAYRPWFRLLQMDDDRFDAEVIILGFCGKIYAGYRMKYSERSGYITNSVTEYIFSLPHLEEVLARISPEYHRITFPKKLNKNSWRPDSSFRRESCARFFERDHLKDYGELFHQHKVPIFSIQYRSEPQRKGIFTLNPCLKDFSFVKTVDPFTAFQEIMMYIPGVLGVGEPDTVQVSDKTMAAKKGFDSCSFKTLAPGKKFKRRSKA